MTATPVIAAKAEIQRRPVWTPACAGVTDTFWTQACAGVTCLSVIAVKANLVIPAKAGIQWIAVTRLGPGLRRDDEDDGPNLVAIREVP